MRNRLPARTSKFDLTLNLREMLGSGNQPAGLEGMIEYSLDLFDPATVELIAARFMRLLEQAVVTPDEHLHRLCVLDDAERHELLDEFNATTHPVPQETIPELFEAQVVRRPRCRGDCVWTASLSYRDLNARANQLAHHLVSLGVHRETLVGVCVDRSFAMVAALLAILKAGAAYVPIAPELPAAPAEHADRGSRPPAHADH